MSKGSSIQYVREIFQKTNIFSRPDAHLYVCLWGVRNISFWENIAYVRTGWSQKWKCWCTCRIYVGAAKRCSECGVNEVFISSILLKKNIDFPKLIRKVNDTFKDLYSNSNIYFSYQMIMNIGILLQWCTNQYEQHISFN